MGISGSAAELHMRTDVIDLVTSTQTKHLPEQREAVRMITQLKREVCSGAIDDLARVGSVDCMADCLTKSSAMPECLIKGVNTAELPNADEHPPFRELMRRRRKAYLSLASWLTRNLPDAGGVMTFLASPERAEIGRCLASINWCKE
jgi:hypothetical protein